MLHQVVIDKIKQCWQTGDVILRAGNAKPRLFPVLPFSRLTMSVTKSKYSHASLVFAGKVVEVSENLCEIVNIHEWAKNCYYERVALLRPKPWLDREPPKRILARIIRSLMATFKGYNYKLAAENNRHGLFTCIDSVLWVLRQCGIRVEDMNLEPVGQLVNEAKLVPRLIGKVAIKFGFITDGYANYVGNETSGLLTSKQFVKILEIDNS
jgi:hypothetical protein